MKYDKIDWSRDLKLDVKRGKHTSFDETKIRTSLYRPFNKRNLYFDRLLNEEIYSLEEIFPDGSADNKAIFVSAAGTSKPFHCFITNLLADIHFTGDSQCFPFYIFPAEDEPKRKENISVCALKTFQKNYHNQKITKWDIFYYIYGILHHPGYRNKFGSCLKKAFPHIPFAPDFRAFADAGARLAELHLNYETVAPYPLGEIVSDKLPYSMRVEDRMRLSKDRTRVVVNPSLTLAGVPAAAFEYRLGNRSALEWVLDQYQVKKDERTGVVSDPNKYGPPDYIVKLVGRVIAVSLETVKIVKSLPEDFGA